MSIIQIIKEQMNMTERERDICRYILENPEKIEEMSSRELGHATFTSAASVTRFCQKIGVKGFPEFKMQFVRELRTGGMEDVSAVTMSERENKGCMRPCPQTDMWQLLSVIRAKTSSWRRLKKCCTGEERKLS